MTQRSVEHATFTVERAYAAPPDQVFAAWSTPEAKREWFGASDHELDFRVGGTEVNRGGPDGGPVFTYEARYLDIVESRRIVYAYDMYMGDTRISVSMATVELSPDGSGTKLSYTEYGAYLDGHDTPAQRNQGMEQLLETLGSALTGQAA